MFTKSVQIMLDESTFRKSARQNAKVYDLLKIALETWGLLVHWRQ